MGVTHFEGDDVKSSKEAAGTFVDWAREDLSRYTLVCWCPSGPAQNYLAASEEPGPVSGLRKAGQTPSLKAPRPGNHFLSIASSTGKEVGKPASNTC